MSDEKRVSVEEEGHLLASATIRVDDAGSATAQVSVAPGHLPVGTRGRMAEQIHDVVSEAAAEHLTAAVPLGDAELVDGLRQGLRDEEVRAAGATTIIEGRTEPR